jgi:hypothetical protein
MCDVILKRYRVGRDHTRDKAAARKRITGAEITNKQEKE